MNFGTQAKSILGAIAPIIGGALGGPFGAAAGLVLQKALGVSDPKAIEVAVTSGDPDILLKMAGDMDTPAGMAKFAKEAAKAAFIEHKKSGAEMQKELFAQLSPEGKDKAIEQMLKPHGKH
jgi:hypothetical protein